MDGADAPTSTAIVEGADADDGEKERRAPKLAAVVEGTDADDTKSRERVFTTRGCGFDSCTQSLCISLLYTYA